MKPKHEKELAKLRFLWATGRATKKQMMRCMELEREEKANSK